MNEGDQASIYEISAIEVALKNRVKFDEKSLDECLLCGSDIPEERKKTGSVKHCIECAEILEKKKRHYRY
jgi:RNA polymerase-binding transcription factor DksA